MLRSFVEIETEFAIATTQIKEALHNNRNNISVALLIERLCATSAVSNKKVPIFDDDISEKINSVGELWKKLKRFWNILDYDVLILVINLAECSEAREILDVFLAKIDPSALEDMGLVLHYRVYQEELTQPLLRIKVNAEKCTFDVKKAVKQIIAKKFDLQEYALYFKAIKEGCFQFVYCISKAVMSYLLEFKITGSIMADFAAYNIISLQINDDTVLKVPTKIGDMVSSVNS